MPMTTTMAQAQAQAQAPARGPTLMTTMPTSPPTMMTMIPRPAADDPTRPMTSLTLPRLTPHALRPRLALPHLPPLLDP